jgi:hypothetical protein
MSSINPVKMVPRRGVSAMAPQYAEEDIYADLVQQGMEVAEDEMRESAIDDPAGMGNDSVGEGMDELNDAGSEDDEESRAYAEPPVANDEKLRLFALD